MMKEIVPYWVHKPLGLIEIKDESGYEADSSWARSGQKKPHSITRAFVDGLKQTAPEDSAK